jgi:hypothetical protein
MEVLFLNQVVKTTLEVCILMSMLLIGRARMSSNYLNYELSKELHDLGVVFEGEGLWTSQIQEQSLLHSSGRLQDDCVCHPSTAQLIDKIREYIPFSIYSFSDILGEIYNEECATTGLGKTLIILVKERQ